MCRNLSTPGKSLNRQSKDKRIEDQFNKTTAYFYTHIATMKMASIATGIDRANICRYIAKLRKHSQIKKVYTSICRITKERAGYYTTNMERAAQ